MKGVSPTAMPIYLITGSKIKYRLVCALFIGKSVLYRVKSWESENLSVIHSKLNPPAKLGCRNLSDTNFGQY